MGLFGRQAPAHEGEGPCEGGGPLTALPVGGEKELWTGLLGVALSSGVAPGQVPEPSVPQSPLLQNSDNSAAVRTAWGRNG